MPLLSPVCAGAGFAVAGRCASRFPLSGTFAQLARGMRANGEFALPPDAAERALRLRGNGQSAVTARLPGHAPACGAPCYHSDAPCP